MFRNGHKINDELWNRFVDIAEENGVSTEDEIDWGAWWDFWIAGYEWGKLESQE